MKNYTEDELDDFINKIEDVNQKVKDIIEGKVDLEELNRREADDIKLEKTKEEIKKREVDEKLKKGRPGKGHQRGYVKFCRHCFTEFMIDIIKCTHCGRDTMTQEERIDELKDKLEVHKEKVRRKKERKAKWDNYRKTQALIYNKTTTNYTKWDAFESSEVSEREDSEPILPRDDPNFRAMEADFQDRRKRRQREKKEADALKVKGNEALQKGLYKTAQKYYCDALELRKDILPLYTNRALARLKLEDYPGVIDDCTRVLEYCEVFHDGYLQEKDLCYKALMRRCQALRGQKDYELAMKDLQEAEKLVPGDENVQKFTKLTLEDIEVEKRIKNIMSNAELLKGKEYIDFLLDVLQGRKDQVHKDKKFCYHELTMEETQKLKINLVDTDIIYYFNLKEGFKTLADSLEFNTNALDIMQKLLENDEKLQEDFQRQKLYEQLIEFLYKSNQNTESKILAPEIIHQILEILETGSMNEFVRGQLSEKKKIKDLFLVVINAVQVEETRKLLSSLIQFVSNLCYGTGKFRTMLRNENPSEFLKTLKVVLQSTEKEDQDKLKNGDRILLKHSVLAFIGNLCVDPQLRQHVASNTQGILDQVYQDFERDITQKTLLWQESVSKEIAILINTSVEPSAQQLLLEKQIIPLLDKLLTTLQYKGEEQELINRIINLLAKLARDPKGATHIAESKNILLRVLLYFNKSFPAMLNNCLRILHSCCKTPNFRTVCLDQHGFTQKNFDTYVTEVQELFMDCLAKADHDNLINCCSSVSAFSEVFPERMSEFKSLVVPLIDIVKEKVDLVRKNAAVCLARLARDEECGKVMRENHGTEVLVSLGSILTK